MYIVKEETEYKIFRVPPDLNDTFQKEQGKRVVAEADNLGDLINKFQTMRLDKMHFNPEIGSYKATEEENSKKNVRQKFHRLK